MQSKPTSKNKRAIAPVSTHVSAQPTAIRAIEAHDTSGLIWNQEQIKLIKSQISTRITDAELVLFSQVCKRTGLDPFIGQIYAIHRASRDSDGQYCYKMTIQTGIDGLRLVADRTRIYAGSDRALFDEGLTAYQHLKQRGGTPEVAEVTVYKMIGGQRCPFVGTAIWNEFVQKDKYGNPQGKWGLSPYNQLAKCAEAQALRKAFPNETGGLLLGEDDEFGGDRTPIDYLQSDLWLRFQSALFTCHTEGEIQAAAAPIEAAIARGELPPIARNSVEREMAIARERAHGRMGIRSLPPVELPPLPPGLQNMYAAPVPVPAHDYLPELSQLATLVGCEWSVIEQLATSTIKKSIKDFQEGDYKKLRAFLFLDWAAMKHPEQGKHIAGYWREFLPAASSESKSDRELLQAWQKFLEDKLVQPLAKPEKASEDW